MLNDSQTTVRRLLNHIFKKFYKIPHSPTQKSYLHFYPEIDIEIVENTVKTNLGNIIFENIIEIKPSIYFFNDEFNVRKPAKLLTLIFENSLTITINHRQPP